MSRIERYGSAGVRPLGVPPGQRYPVFQTRTAAAGFVVLLPSVRRHIAETGLTTSSEQTLFSVGPRPLIGVAVQSWRPFLRANLCQAPKWPKCLIRLEILIDVSYGAWRTIKLSSQKGSAHNRSPLTPVFLCPCNLPVFRILGATSFK